MQITPTSKHNINDS